MFFFLWEIFEYRCIKMWLYHWYLLCLTKINKYNQIESSRTSDRVLQVDILALPLTPPPFTPPPPYKGT